MSTDINERSTEDLVEQYVALWNEGDPAARAAMIRQLWGPDGEHVLDPPDDLIKAAQDLGFATAGLEVKGYAALERRAARAYDEFVRPGEHRFRARANAVRLRDLVKFGWEMVRTADEQVVGVGLEVLQLAPDGRIAVDYQFVEG